MSGHHSLQACIAMLAACQVTDYHVNPHLPEVFKNVPDSSPIGVPEDQPPTSGFSLYTEQVQLLPQLAVVPAQRHRQTFALPWADAQQREKKFCDSLQAAELRLCCPRCLAWV